MLPVSRLEDLRRQRPLIHCISNFVTANDCANVALAVGASPIMAQAPEEMEQITRLSAATVLNTGTPDREKFAACRISGAAAAGTQPVVLDPVGVGSSPWRLAETERLLQAFTPDVLRVNTGEAQALLHSFGQEQGVDSVTAATERERIAAARALARQVGAVVLLTGESDLVCGETRLCRIDGGSCRMAMLTGAGCMLSVLCGAFAAVEPDVWQAVCLASAFWKVCAARAERMLGPDEGMGRFHMALLDAASTLTAADLQREARLELL